jgi:hypothetical protein
MIRNLQSLSSSNEKSDTSRRDHLLQLAAWYRARAECAGSPWIWEARLQRADDLEREARNGRSLRSDRLIMKVETGA